MAKKETYIKMFRHFAFRLSERYGILITFEQYCQLCKLNLNDFEILKKDNKQDCGQGILQINGVNVLVRKYILSHKMLLTAIPLPKNKNKYEKCTGSSYFKRAQQMEKRR